MPVIPDAPYFELSPDWVCEVLSPSTASLDRTKKLFVYAREKVGHMWIVDPLARTLEILRLDGDTYRIAAVAEGDAKVRAEPFEAIELDLAILWAR
jgi:Uma2 family endonuclease